MDLLSRHQAAAKLKCATQTLMYLEETGRIKPIPTKRNGVTIIGYTPTMIKELKPLIRARSHPYYPPGMNICDAKYLDQDKKE